MSIPTVCFLDSGIGGLPYLQAARPHLRGYRLAYLADREHYPFGTKEPELLRRQLLARVTELYDAFQPSCIVLACNTATVVALEELRKRFAVPFVGVVPAIKPAAEESKGNGIALLATSRTVQERYVADLAGKFAPHLDVFGVESGTTVNFVENRWGHATEEERLAAAASALEAVDLNHTDAVVLGCTHFVYLRPYMERLLDGRARLIDSVEGVARQIGRVCGPLEAPTSLEAPDVLVVTGVASAPAGYESIAKELGLELQVGL